eukprot:413421-Rhodomonas_salina.4
MIVCLVCQHHPFGWVVSSADVAEAVMLTWEPRGAGGRGSFSASRPEEMKPSEQRERMEREGTPQERERARTN